MYRGRGGGPGVRWRGHVKTGDKTDTDNMVVYLCRSEGRVDGGCSDHQQNRHWQYPFFMSPYISCRVLPYGTALTIRNMLCDGTTLYQYEDNVDINMGGHFTRWHVNIDIRTFSNIKNNNSYSNMWTQLSTWGNCCQHYDTTVNMRVQLNMKAQLSTWGHDCQHEAGFNCQHEAMT
jgi:hypothetical protein